MLSVGALASLQRFAAEATVWHEVKEGYLGAYFDEGLQNPLLLQVVSQGHKQSVFAYESSICWHVVQTRGQFDSA